ncbi:MAG: response regulator [Deltaproteobacteria bacterium]|nr:response regulator [Deltaproteobacteria bacterium]
MLIVDDEPLVRSVLRRILEPHHEVVELGSGADAQRLLVNDRAFDLIWCDVTMPNVTGQELYEWLAARDPQAAERVVFVTGGTFTSRAHAFLAQVANPKLEKPFDVHTVRELVDTLLADRPPRS